MGTATGASWSTLYHTPLLLHTATGLVACLFVLPVPHPHHSRPLAFSGLPQVSEHASWSSLYYGRIIKAALQAAGAPEDLVQIVTGYGEAGNAIVTGGG